MAIDPAGRFLFVSSGNTPDLFAFTIDPNIGTLSAVAGSPFSLGCVSFMASLTIPPTGCSPGGMAVDPSGAYLYVTGGLAQFSGSPVAAWPDPSAGAYNLTIAP